MAYYITRSLFDTILHIGAATVGVVCVKAPRKILDVGFRHPQLFWQLHYNGTTVFLTFKLILHLLLQIVGYYMTNRDKRYVKSCKCIKCIRSLFSQVEHCIFIVKFYWRFKYYHTSLKNTEGKRVMHATKIVQDLCIPTCRPTFWTRPWYGRFISPLRQGAFLLINSRGNFLPITLVVRVEQSVHCLCLCVQTLTL